MISITGLNKASVLKVLFNASKVQGVNAQLGLKPEDLSISDAQEILDNRDKTRIYFDYLNGKVMKIDLTSNDEFNPWLYDRDNGEGAAQKAVNTLK